ncbi:uncharacterized protein LOC122296768 [Carya illinoinensis]|uniref:uncharacterized protein LOC122296768 n=1 Tax=Carya illinoinensis TaxID=32201 RepID=UPI001C71FC26|nr:uncharacterized protein LOC122296768 [Carya illinoinensis]
MEAEDLVKRWERLQLTTEESIPFHVNPEGSKKEDRMSEHCIVGRAMVERPVNSEAFRTTMSQVWRLDGWIRFIEIGDQSFIIEFQKLEDKDKVLGGRPWFFDRCLLSLQEVDDTVSINKTQFRYEPFWVQLHNLPLATMNEEVGSQFAASIGHVIRVETESDGRGWGRCLRVRVAVDILKPLLRGKWMRFEEEEHWISFKYERLQNFCFHCGILNHKGKNCNKLRFENQDAEQAPLQFAKRKTSWQLLEMLKPPPPMAWLCAGDFNEILHQGEKQGAGSRPYKQIEEFRKVVEVCDLRDIHHQGHYFTWSNNRRGRHFTKERIDRALANKEWHELFSNASCTTLAAIQSDHSPLSILLQNSAKVYRHEARCFRYEVAWDLKEDCKKVVEYSWKGVSLGLEGANTVRQRLSACQRNLSQWSQTEKTMKHKDINQAVRRIRHLQEMGTGNHITEMQGLQKGVELALSTEEMKWRQRAKQHWMKVGDRNTTFFHLQASHRRKANSIVNLEDPQGRILTKQEDIGSAFTGYFSSLFTTSSPSNYETCLDALETKLSNEMENWLLLPFTREEIYTSVTQMNPLGSPGPDGFPASFYQKHWGVVGEEVCSYALQVLNHGGSCTDVNDTLISLIPKVKNPIKIPDFRPISLCNVLYKIISKTIANRFKTILPKLISLNQTAFVPGRLITDNVLVAYETLHSMSTRMKGKKGCLALKLDMSKAYDRIEWGFVEAIMSKMGFPFQWISLVQRCLTSISYSILVNGKPQQNFLPSRGLRQGDPLSPYIFIMCAEALSSLLNQAEHSKVITPVHVGRGPITVNHLFFADDSLLFCQANPKEVSSLLDILSVYERASGQVLNRDKSSVFFSKNTKRDTRVQIQQLVGVRSTGSFEKYLGLPVCVGRKKVAAFCSLVDRTWSRLESWKTKHLSGAGKEVLLKAVLQAIPTYAMGIFQLPASITGRLNQLLRKHWWGYNEDTSKIQWVSWNQLSNSKDHGGLGFRDFRSFNISLLSKQGWRIQQNPSSLVARIFKQKYFGQSDLLEAKLGSRPSLAWRGVYAGLEVLREGLIWRIGTGSGVNIWTDRWIPSLPNHKVSTPREPDCWCDLVSDLIDPTLRVWKDSLLEELFSPQEREAIKAIPISPVDREDRMVWLHSSNGQFSVKSGYHLHRAMEVNVEGESSCMARDQQAWKAVWKFKTSPAVKMFIWRACSEALPTLANLKRRRVVEDNLCFICKQAPETSGHSLWNCVASQDVLNQSCRKVQKMSYQSNLFFDVWSQLVEALDTRELEEVAVILRGIWSRRNDILHGRPFKHPTRVFHQALADHNLYKESFQDVGKVGVKTQTKAQKWTKPEEDHFKVNWDVAVRTGEGRIGVGVLIRDHTGQVVGALRAQRPFRGRPFDAEAYGALMAAIFIKELGLNKVCLEGDSKQVVDLLQKYGLDWSMGGCLVRDAREILNSCTSWSCSHVLRGLNEAAHQLAQMAMGSMVDVYDIELCPECIMSVVTKEMK